MSTLTIFSVSLITLALIFYSIGVWAERVSRYLKSWHVIFLRTGFTFDVSGTCAMHLVATGPFDLTEPHTLTGQIALWLKLFHAVRSSKVVIESNSTLRESFHKFSLFIRIIWLIPYF